MVNRLEATIRR